MLNALEFQIENILGSVVALSVLLVYYIATLAAAMLLIRGVRKVSFPKLLEGLSNRVKTFSETIQKWFSSWS